MNFKEKFNSISEIIEKNIGEPDDKIIDTIVKEFTAEKRSMAYAFFFIVGCRLPEYIRRRKLCVAFHKVQGGKAKWEDVLEIAGYSERSSFDKAFKKEYGSSPVQYLKGTRYTELVEPIKIMNIEWNHLISNKQGKNANAKERCTCILGGKKMNNNIKNTKEKDVEKLNKYLDLQALYDLSVSQIMFAERYCDKNINIYLACDALEKEYKDLQPEDFDAFYQDCYYISIHCRYAKELAEKIVKDIQENTLLNVQQLDVEYLNAIGQSIATYRNKGLAKNLPYEYFEKIKNTMNAGEDDPNLYKLCSDFADGYKLDELANILDNYSNRIYEQNVWYIMYQLNMKRNEAEDFIKILKNSSNQEIKEMDTEYFWFLEWYNKEDREMWAKKMPYEKYTELKKQVVAAYIYEPLIIEDVLRLFLETERTLEQSINYGLKEQILSAILTLKREYVRTTIDSLYYSQDEIMDILNEYYPQKVPAYFFRDLKNGKEIENLLEAHFDKWSYMSECDELEFIVAISNGITIEESREIVSQRLEKDKIDRDDVEGEYVYLHEHYFNSTFFDQDNKWDGRLIPDRLYQQLFEYAHNHAGETKNIWMPALAKIAYDIMFNECTTIEEAFEKYPNYDLIHYNN